MKRKTAIMIDSGCAPTPQLLQQNNLEFIGIHINMDDRQFEDGVGLTKNDFYEKVPRARSFSTSPPSPKQILDRYRRIKEKGYDELVDIHFSAKMTELVANSFTARDFTTGMDIHIIDTQSVSAGAYFTAVKVIELLAAGWTMADIESVLPRIINASLILISASTLKYFVKNGRIGKAQGVVGNLMRVKPVLTIEDGMVAPFAKEKGIDNAINTMADSAFQFLLNRRHNVKIYKDYGSEKNRVFMEKAFDRFMEKFRSLNIRNFEVISGRGWPTVTCHSGPEVFALSVYGETEPIH